jgi:HlyD family secretion protein
VDDSGQLKPIDVRLGLSDGSYTELRAGDLKDGTQVIIGMAGADKKAGQTGGPRFGL